MSTAQTSPRADAEMMWSPDPERVEASNITRLMRANGISDLKTLRARALDPEWLWPAIFDDLGLGYGCDGGGL